MHKISGSGAVVERWLSTHGDARVRSLLRLPGITWRMRVLVTGSAGHLGEALLRVMTAEGFDVLGIDMVDSPYTAVVGSITDRSFVRDCMAGVDAVVHTATLHKPHVATHTRWTSWKQT